MMMPEAGSEYDLGLETAQLLILLSSRCARTACSAVMPHNPPSSAIWQRKAANGSGGARFQRLGPELCPRGPAHFFKVRHRRRLSHSPPPCPVQPYLRSFNPLPPASPGQKSLPVTLQSGPRTSMPPSPMRRNWPVRAPSICRPGSRREIQNRPKPSGRSSLDPAERRLRCGYRRRRGSLGSR